MAVKFEVLIKKENDHFICEITDLATWNRLVCKFVPGLYWDVEELKFVNPKSPHKKLFELGLDTRFQVRIKDLAREMEKRNIKQTVVWVYY